MWSIFVAIISHKVMESFSMGLILNKGFKRLWVVLLFIVSFSIASPLGIGIGIGIAEIGESPGLALARYFLLSLASGAFVHVAIFETLDKNHQPSNAILMVLKFVLFTTGFAIMAVIAIWV